MMAWLLDCFFWTSVVLLASVHFPMLMSLGNFLQDMLGSKDHTYQRQFQVRIEAEMCSLQQRNYKLCCKGMAFVVLMIALALLRYAILAPDVCTIGQFAVMLLAYVHHMVVGLEVIELNPVRKKIVCYIVHCLALSGSIFISAGAKDLISFLTWQPFLAAARFVELGCLDTWVTFSFHVLHAAVDSSIYVVLLEERSWTTISPMLISQASFLLVTSTASLILQLWVRTCIEAKLQTADAESLVSSFRKMLRGVYGEVLLDNQLTICGDSECVKHLLMTTVSMAGKPFDRLLVDEERDRFVQFIQSSSEIFGEPTSKQQSQHSAFPACLRVSLRGSAGLRVGADLYHVAVAGLYGAEPFHLLAFKEDVESREQPAQEDEIWAFRPTQQPAKQPAKQPAPVAPLRSDASAEHFLQRAASQVPSVSSCSSASTSSLKFQSIPELHEMTLLVDVNTELQDVKEAHMKFQRREEDAQAAEAAEAAGVTAELQSSMPSLRKMVKPTEWQNICSRVMRFAERASWDLAIEAKVLKQMSVRFPDDRKFLVAQNASIKPFPGPKRGSKVWIHMIGFRPEKSRRSHQRQPSLQHIKELTSIPSRKLAPPCKGSSHPKEDDKSHARYARAQSF